MLLVTPEKIASIMALFPVPHSFSELDALVSHLDVFHRMGGI